MKPLLTILLMLVLLNADAQYRRLLDPETFNKLLNRQFTNLVTGQTTNTLGSFAALDLKETSLSFNGSQIFGNGNVLSVTASGAVSDGLFALFNNSKLNTGVSVGAQYHILSPYSKTLNYDLDDYLNVQRDSTKNMELFRIRKRNIEGKIDSLSWQVQIQTLQKEILSIPKATTEREAAANRIVLERNRASIDSLQVLLNQYDYRSALDNLRSDSLALTSINSDKLTLLGFKFGWWTVGYSAVNTSFKTIDPSLSYDNQVEDRQYTGHEVKLQYNLYNWNHAPFESFFWLIGASFGIGNNQTDLKKREVRDYKVFMDSTDNRTLTEVYDAYEGTYKKDLKKVRFYTEYYRFLFSKNVAALHLYPEVSLRSGKAPVYNTGIGLLYSFKDSKDDKGKATVNVELYYQFTDLTNSLDSENDLFERNQIGLRVAFPFKFLN